MVTKRTSRRVALDVFSRHPPLTGLSSTSEFYGGIHTNHPGPIEFYLLAIPLRLFGPTAGPLFTAAAINGGFVLVVLWVFFRRLGLTAALWAGVLLLAVMASGGTAVLTDTLSSNMTMYSLMCTAVLAWALVDGDLRLLPLAAFVASYAAQQHLAAGLIVVVLVATALVVLIVQVVQRARRGETVITCTARRCSIGAAAVGVVCWAPVLDDQFTGHPGNLSQIVRFAQTDNRATLGLRSGFDQAVHAVVPPTVLGRTDTTGRFFVSAPGSVTLVLGFVIIAALAALIWRLRRSSPAVAKLSAVVLVLLAAGIVDGSNVPMSLESGRVNLYRWTWAAALLAWSAIGVGVATVIGEVGRLKAYARRVSSAAPIALLLTAALIAVSVAWTNGSDDHNRERPNFALERRVTKAVLARIDQRRPLLVSTVGSDATLSVAPHIIFELVRAGVRVQVPATVTETYGDSRRYRPRSGAARLIVFSGKAVEPSGPGELIAVEHYGPAQSAEYERLAARRTALLDELSAAALGKKVELAPEADAFINRLPASSRYVLAVMLGNLPTDPRSALGWATFLQLARSGLIRSPAFDQSKLLELLTLPAYGHRGAFGDERVEVRLVPAGQS